jgi:hypothetical protein
MTETSLQEDVMKIILAGIGYRLLHNARQQTLVVVHYSVVVVEAQVYLLKQAYEKAAIVV